MKKLFIFLSFFTSFHFILGQQKNLGNKTLSYSGYYSIGLGYNFPTGGRISQATDNEDGTRTYTSVPGSYGKGGIIYATRGMMIHPNIGLECAFSYSFGGRTNTKNYFIQDTVQNPYKLNQEVKQKANIFRINPSLIFIVPFKKISPYIKLGLAYGWAIAKWEIHEDVKFYSGGTTIGDFEWRISRGNGFSFNSSLGILIKTKDEAIDFFVELRHVNQGIYFKKGSLQKFNGQVNLYNVPTSEKEFVYTDSETEDKISRTNLNQDPSKPREYLKFRSNFDCIGLNFGMLIKFK